MLIYGTIGLSDDKVDEILNVCCASLPMWIMIAVSGDHTQFDNIIDLFCLFKSKTETPLQRHSFVKFNILVYLARKQVLRYHCSLILCFPLPLDDTVE